MDVITLDKSPSLPSPSEAPSALLSPDFSHRLSALGAVATPACLCDAVGDACAEARAVLALVLIHFDGSGESAMSQDSIYWALHSVSRHLKDINSIVAAFHTASKPN